MNSSTITIRQVYDTEVLIQWRMMALRCVFSISGNTDTTALQQANRHYYERHLPDGSHIARIAYMGDEAVGCGGVCLYDEMPSPDNPNGRCAYLMNIYVRPAFRRRRIARRIIR